MRLAAQHYEEDDEGDSEMSGAHVDEEVAVTKRGRAVKLPAKYKAEVSFSILFAACEPCSEYQHMHVFVGKKVLSGSIFSIPYSILYNI